MLRSEFDEHDRLAFHRNSLVQVQSCRRHGYCRADAHAGGAEDGLHVNYLIANVLAVETAVLHNLLWHERFTWADRTGASFTRFLKFNLTTGLFSLAGNLVSMKLLVGIVHLNYLLANGITITACSVVNFLVSAGFVFAGDRTEIQST
jgi:putative flippase GtrA